MINAELIFIKKQLLTILFVSNFTIRIYIWLLRVSQSQKFGSLLGSFWTTLPYTIKYSI